MSADNYWYIDYLDGRYAVTMGFMSNEEDPEPRASTAWFERYRDLLDADLDWTEYGEVISDRARTKLLAELDNATEGVQDTE